MKELTLTPCCRPPAASQNATICYDTKACAANAATHYYSNLYSAAYGLSVLGPATKTITAALKNAGVGANYSPLDYNPHGGYTQFQYWYPVNKAGTPPLPLFSSSPPLWLMFLCLSLWILLVFHDL